MTRVLHRLPDQIQNTMQRDSRFLFGQVVLYKHEGFEWNGCLLTRIYVGDTDEMIVKVLLQKLTYGYGNASRESLVRKYDCARKRFQGMPWMANHHKKNNSRNWLFCRTLPDSATDVMELGKLFQIDPQELWECCQ